MAASTSKSSSFHFSPRKDGPASTTHTRSTLSSKIRLRHTPSTTELVAGNKSQTTTRQVRCWVLTSGNNNQPPENCQSRPVTHPSQQKGLTEVREAKRRDQARIFVHTTGKRCTIRNWPSISVWGVKSVLSKSTGSWRARFLWYNDGSHCQ